MQTRYNRTLKIFWLKTKRCIPEKYDLRTILRYNIHRVNFKSEGASNNIQLKDKCELSLNAYPPPFLLLLLVNYDGSLVITISHREKLRLGLFEWSSIGDTVVVERRFVNTSVGAPLTDTA